MSVRQIVVPNPAAGQDWTLVMPGQYVAQLISATATLTTLAHPTTAVDSGGSGLTATYSGKPNITYGNVGPFGAGGGFAVKETVPSSAIWICSFPNSGGQFDTATMSVDALVNFAHLGSASMNEIACIRDSSGAHPTLVRWIFGLDSGGGGRIAATSGNVFSLPGISAALNTWAHVGFSYDGTQWVGYQAGVAGTPVVGNPFAAANTTKAVSLGGDLLSNQNFDGLIAAVAIYPGVLSGAQFAAHNAAVATSAAAYKAAVLADSPTALWMLDETDTFGSRLASLEITDGTHVLADYPASFAATSGSTYVWAWVVEAPGAVQTVTGGNNIVPIPPTTLPAGYTIGTRTPGLSALDQWSGISIWFDDGAIGPGGPVGPYEFPPSVHLVYQQRPPSS